MGERDDDQVLTPYEWRISWSISIKCLMPRCVKKLISDMQPLELGDLSLDILSMVAEALFGAWPKATCLGRVSKVFLTISKDTQVRLRNANFAWWTGAGAPLRPMVCYQSIMRPSRKGRSSTTCSTSWCTSAFQVRRDLT